MQQKPMIFLLSLFVILIFILGVRYGQRVEQTNKTINYILSLTPTHIPTTPTVVPVKFDNYEHKGCGVKFLYPSTIIDITQSSGSGSLNRGEQNLLELSCEKNNDIANILKDPNAATAEIKFQKGSLKGKTNSINNETFLYFQTKNPYSNQSVYFMIEKNLYPLFDKSLEFFLPTTLK